MLRALLSLIVAVLALAGCTGVKPSTGQAPDLGGELLTGGTFDPATVRGKVVVVNFWASWCPPCRAEADDLEKTYEQTKAKGVAFIGVNTRDERDAAKAFLVGRGTYPNLVDPAGKVALRFDVPPTAIPSTIIIGRDGTIAAVFRRPVVQSELQPLVEQLAGGATGG